MTMNIFSEYVLDLDCGFARSGRKCILLVDNSTHRVEGYAMQARFSYSCVRTLYQRAALTHSLLAEGRFFYSC